MSDAVHQFWKALTVATRDPRPDWGAIEQAIRALSDELDAGPVWPYLICHSRRVLDDLGMTKYRQRKLGRIATRVLDESRRTCGCAHAPEAGGNPQETLSGSNPRIPGNALRRRP